jgi:HEAT repeat protein
MAPSRNDLVALIEDPPAFLTSADPVLRRMATTALSADEARSCLSELGELSSDDLPEVRAAVAEKLGVCGRDAVPLLLPLRDDQDPIVREAVATACGELGDPDALPWLEEVASSDPDRAVREAAVASLGSIGDAAAIDTLLRLIADAPPQVRRRAIAAITVFDDPRIEPAITRAAFDRNPGVREAAEMVVGRQIRSEL